MIPARFWFVVLSSRTTKSFVELVAMAAAACSSTFVRVVSTTTTDSVPASTSGSSARSCRCRTSLRTSPSCFSCYYYCGFSLGSFPERSPWRIVGSTAVQERKRGRWRAQSDSSSTGPSPSSPVTATSTYEASTLGTEFTGLEGAGSGSGMSLEEKTAILEFAGLSEDDLAEPGPSPSMELEPKPAQGEKLARPLPREAAYAKENKVKGRGKGVAGPIMVYMKLLDKPFGSDARMIAAAGSAVLERVEDEVEILRGVEGVDRQCVFEILRVVKLLRMDIQLLAAARKEATIFQRLKETNERCEQLLSIASVL